MEPIEPSRPVECAGAWAKISTISHAYPPLHGIADEIDVKVTEFIKKKGAARFFATVFTVAADKQCSAHEKRRRAP
jgi:hypothetical protein